MIVDYPRGRMEIEVVGTDRNGKKVNLSADVFFE